MKVIGKKKNGLDYENRHASYGLIFNDKKEIAIIDIDDFGYNLPGGKLEVDEDPIVAFQREVSEEMGYDVLDINFLESVKSYHEVRVRGSVIPTIADLDFYTANIGKKNAGKIEDNHHLIWMSLDDANGKMYFDAHNYIIDKYIKDMALKNYEWINEYVVDKNGVYQHFKEEWNSYLYMIDKKYFIMQGHDKDGRCIITLKLDESTNERIQKEYPNMIVPGYYCNKKLWSSIYFDQNPDEKLLKDLLDQSYLNFINGFPKKRRMEIEEGLL